jgi:hypothetical protein
VRRSTSHRGVAFPGPAVSKSNHMTQSSAEKFANVVIGAAAVGAAFYVLKTPRLRTLAWQLSLAALTSTLPAWINQEIRAGWEASGQRSSSPALSSARAS